MVPANSARTNDPCLLPHSVRLRAAAERCVVEDAANDSAPLPEELIRYAHTRHSAAESRTTALTRAWSETDGM